MQRKLERRGYRATRYDYPPGTYFPPHRHAMGKIDAVISGRFRLTLSGKSFDLEAGDMLAVPHDIVHEAEVVGDETVVSLDAVRND